MSCLNALKQYLERRFTPSQATKQTHIMHNNAIKQFCGCATQMLFFKNVSLILHSDSPESKPNKKKP